MLQAGSLSPEIHIGGTPLTKVTIQHAVEVDNPRDQLAYEVVIKAMIPTSWVSSTVNAALP
jgi:hypothetical protein